MGRVYGDPGWRWSGAPRHRPDHRTAPFRDHRTRRYFYPCRVPGRSAGARSGREPGGAGTLAVMPRPLVAVLWFVLAIAVMACGSAIPVVSFDPASPCTTDGRQPGAYPDLEAVLPTTYEGRTADNVDSGRSCTPVALGRLADLGIAELRFAGATWGLGGTAGLTVAAFEATGLDPAAMIEFYAQSAKANRKTEKLQVSDATAGGLPARRLDVLQSDGAYQTIVAWPAGVDGRVMVLLAADIGDTRVAAAVEAFAGE